MKKSATANLIVGVFFVTGALASNYLANIGPEADRFAVIGMGPGISGTAADNIAHLPKISLLVLDIYGSEDLPQMLESSAVRAVAATCNPAFQWVVVAGADHFFEGEEEDLLKYV